MSTRLGLLHIIRHGEATHNIPSPETGKLDFNQRDPYLTPTGVHQALSLSTTFTHGRSTALVLSSPMRRTLQTSLLGFLGLLDEGLYLDEEGEKAGFPGREELDKKVFKEEDGDQAVKEGKRKDIDSNPPTARKIPLQLWPELQERGGCESDTGHPPEELVKEFPGLRREIEMLAGNWHEKKGDNEANYGAICDRAIRVRKMLLETLRRVAEDADAAEAAGAEEEGNGGVRKADGERRDVVVVCHGGFIRSLTENEDAVWGNCAWRSFDVQEWSGGVVKLFEVESQGGDLKE